MLERDIIDEVQHQQAAEAGEGNQQHIHPFFIVVHAGKGVQRHAANEEEE